MNFTLPIPYTTWMWLSVKSHLETRTRANPLFWADPLISISNCKKSWGIKSGLHRKFKMDLVAGICLGPSGAHGTLLDPPVCCGGYTLSPYPSPRQFLVTDYLLKKLCPVPFPVRVVCCASSASWSRQLRHLDHRTTGFIVSCWRVCTWRVFDLVNTKLYTPEGH